MFLVTLVVFIVILSVLVLVHELGHFFAAKIFGVKVEEFGLGFPPNLYRRKIGETVFSLNLIPFGGFVKLLGLEETDKSQRSFSKKSAWQRAVILVSGILMNLVLAVVIFTIGFSIGMTPLIKPTSEYSSDVKNEILITETLENSPAQKSGLVASETVLAGKDQSGWQDFRSITQFQDFTKKNQGQEVILRLKEDGTTQEKAVQLSNGETPLGVGLAEIGLVKIRPDKAFIAACEEVWALIEVIVLFLYQFFKLLFVHGKLSSEVGGPVAIFSYTSAAIKFGLNAVLQFVGLLTVNLALLNILPLPALDGGKLLFVVLEIGFRKKVVRMEVENIIHLIGLILFILLFVIITYRDIIRIVIR